MAASDDPSDELHTGELHSGEGLSLEELSQTYAEILTRSPAPYQEASAKTSMKADDKLPSLFDPIDEELMESDVCAITPRSIIEAVLFIGTADGKPIATEQVAAIMRGVRVEEVTQLVDELNFAYEQAGHAMRIVATGVGYRMQVHESLQTVRDRFYGRIKEARLSQSAVDCLALIVYHPGISRDEIDDQRCRPSGGILNQLVRRNLVEARRDADSKKKKWCFYPTDRLLRITGLESLDELPQVEDWN